MRNYVLFSSCVLTCGSGLQMAVKVSTVLGLYDHAESLTLQRYDMKRARYIIQGRGKRSECVTMFGSQAVDSLAVLVCRWP